ncbi:MAG: C2HC5 finger [Lasallia pustulata]|uniref:C2HC5 finger n=1 Tax=Lasallia pustulata TaxID=136370 RepID=A0A5M8PZ37_9LECA|nr:MAG: C2HC5 finger [Lasallia pustulata]
MASTWAMGQISRLLPLDEESLKQIIGYTNTLPKAEAAEHLKNLLGDSPQALEFITSFNSRREAPKPVAPPSEVPNRQAKRKKAPLNKLPPPRRPEDYGNVSGAYQKKNDEDYMAGSSRHRKERPLANALALTEAPDARQLPVPTSSSTASSRNAPPKPPPSAAGSLISDLPNVRTSSRTSSPAPKTKVNLSGGTPMHGASTALNDLDSAIRALEIQTNPALSTTTAAETAKRRCNCQATRHPLLAAAPNCLNCGKIICVKEGIGPCTFCGRPILSQGEIQSMVRALKEERGKERMDMNNSSQRRAEVSKVPRPFAASTPSASDSEADSKLAAAQQHRDKLLGYQAQNARRTRIIDEAADFETPSSGQSMWSSPVERAAQLKRQQKVLREQEWNAKPEYEKRRMVVSVELVGGKVVKRMGKVERRQVGDEGEDDDGEVEEVMQEQRHGGSGTGTFSRNPLMGSLIRPVWKGAEESEGGKGKEKASGQGSDEAEGNKENRNGNTWRRVQDDSDDNEAWILDGGIYGGREEGRRLGDEERAQGC